MIRWIWKPAAGGSTRPSCGSGRAGSRRQRVEERVRVRGHAPPDAHISLSIRASTPAGRSRPRRGSARPQALAALHPHQSLVPGEVADHPGDRVHRLEPAMRVARRQAAQATHPLGAGESELVDARMGHAGQRTSDAPPGFDADAGRTIAAMSSPTDLPPHVRRHRRRDRDRDRRRAVASDDIDHRGRPGGHDRQRPGRGGRPRDPPRDRRGPRPPGPARARRSASTGCTRS